MYGRALMYKFDEGGAIFYLDDENKANVVMELKFVPYRISYHCGKLYVSKLGSFYQ